MITSEINWINSLKALDEQVIYFTPGFVIHLYKGWEIGLGLPLGITKQAANFGAITILSYEFDLNESD